MSEEDAVVWQEVLDRIVAGATGDLGCPFCGAGTIRIDDRGLRTRLECPDCRRFVEGSFRG